MAVPVKDLGDRLPALVTDVPGPASRRLAKQLQAVESRNVTYMDDEFPVFWEEARGTNVVDADGNVFLDFTGAFGVALAGHAHPTVVGAVEAQTRRLMHGMGDVHPATAKVELLERLVDLAPWTETRAFLAGSGSEAVEAALKTGILASGKPGILAFEGSYHGLTLGALATTHRGHFRRPFQERLFEGVRFAPFPGADLKRGLDELRTALDEGAPGNRPIGTIIIEPIQGRSGVRIPPQGYLEALVGIAQEAGCVVIADEIMTGFGRTGSLFAFPTEDVRPDIICAGKALGGGMPIGVCMARKSIMDAWPPSGGEAIHTSTFLGHPVTSAAALGFLEVLEAERLITRSRDVGSSMLDGLRAALAGVEGVLDVRGRGLMMGVEMGTEAAGASAGAAVRAMKVALGAGLIVLPAGDQGHVVEITPPAVMTSEQIEAGMGILVEAVKAVAAAER